MSLDSCCVRGMHSHVILSSALLSLLLLQHKLCSGANRLSSTLLPTPTADGLSFHNLPTPSSTRATAGQLQPHSQPQHNQQPTATPRSIASTNNQPWQFSMGLLKATHVGPTGFQGQRQPIYHVARIAVLDKSKNRFLGNVHTVPTTEVRSKGLTWCWGPEGPSKTLAGSELPRPEFIPPGQLAGSPAAVAAAAASAGLLDGLTEGPGTFPNLGGDLAGWRLRAPHADKHAKWLSVPFTILELVCTGGAHCQVRCLVCVKVSQLVACCCRCWRCQQFHCEMWQGGS